MARVYQRDCHSVAILYCNLRRIDYENAIYKRCYSKDVPKDFYGCLGRRLAIVRRTSPDIDTNWLYYYFRSPEWTNFIKSKIIKGSTVNRISVEDFPSYTIPKVSLETQKRIVSVLQKIDRKIQLNDAVNDNLQQMAYDTYMHLFFSKTPNGKLGEIIKENSKSTVQVGDAKNIIGDFPFFTSGDAILEWQDSMVDGRNCFLNTGGNAGVKFYVGKAAYSTDTWCITADRGLEDYLYLLLLSIKPELNQKFFQGTGLKHLQKPLLRDRKIYIPTDSEITDFNFRVKPWMNQISANTKENKQLVSLRDWLLPMLMNGQATISD